MGRRLLRRLLVVPDLQPLGAARLVLTREHVARVAPVPALTPTLAVHTYAARHAGAQTLRHPFLRQIREFVQEHEHLRRITHREPRVRGFGHRRHDDPDAALVF